MSYKHIILVFFISLVLAFSLTLVMHDSIDGLGAEQYYRPTGIRG